MYKQKINICILYEQNIGMSISMMPDLLDSIAHILYKGMKLFLHYRFHEIHGLGNFLLHLNTLYWLYCNPSIFYF